MQRAIELAYRGLGKVSPNPMVGCVIVKEGEIIGEGWHQEFGGPHAEVNAINNVIEKKRIRNSDVYVSLEPCSHQGKTPPCADLLIKHAVRNVYIANIDVNPLVMGRGIQKLKDASVGVSLGMEKARGDLLNKRFFQFHGSKRPYIILKWAQTIDRFIARTNFDSKWISNEYSRQLVHKWRSEEDAVMVGANTAFHDNPVLNVRDWPSSNKQPLRILIDPHLKVPQEHKLFNGVERTIVYNYARTDSGKRTEWVKLLAEQFLEDIMTDLYARKVLSVLVEGGSFLINSLIQKNLWDEARIFISDKTFGEGIKAPELYHAELQEKRHIFNDELQFFRKIDD